eukprot:7450425-Lingulodinium_polyedra.AAC.1
MWPPKRDHAATARTRRACRRSPRPNRPNRPVRKPGERRRAVLWGRRIGARPRVRRNVACVACWCT